MKVFAPSVTMSETQNRSFGMFTRALRARAWREVLERHDELVDRVVPEHGGRVVKHIGDGALSAFDGPAMAMRCAEALRDGIAELGIELRAGVHTGECEAIGEDLGGLAVHIGARVGAFAGPGEIVVSSTVKELVVGSGMQFTDRGEHAFHALTPAQLDLHSPSTAGSTAPPGTR
jgi:class 3 adenylate cyclase